MRIAELQESIALYQHFKRPHDSAPSEIQLGALVCTQDSNGNLRYLFIGPAAGGLSIVSGEQSIQVITPTTPLAQALLGKSVDDEIQWQQDSFIVLSIE